MTTSITTKHHPAPVAAAETIVDYVRRFGSVSFVELIRHLEGLGFAPAGKQAIVLPGKNIVLWDGVSGWFVDLMAELIASGRLTMKPTHFLTYVMDGGYLGYPLAKRPPAAGYKRPRWLPVVFNVPAQGLREAA